MVFRLTEIGPRMTLELVKIEEELCGGNVMYHNHIIKTEEEKNSLQDMRARKRFHIIYHLLRLKFKINLRLGLN